MGRWPTLKAVQLARRTTLEHFFRAHHVRSADVITTRLEAIKNARALTTDEGIITPNALLAQALVAQLRVTLQAIADFATAIAQRAHAHPDFPFFDTLPGTGAVVAPRLLVAFGAQRDRYASAEGRRLRMGEESASGVSWGAGLGTGDWEGWTEGTLDRLL